MALVYRQFVSALTAASVLLCGIVCACGDTVHQADSAPTPVASVAGDGHDSHCHRYPGQGTSQGRDGHPQNPEPCKDGGPSCRRCQSNATLASGNAAGVAHLTPFAHFVGIPDVTLHEPWTTPSILSRCSTLGDLPPPLCSTLLSLHCALMT